MILGIPCDQGGCDLQVENLCCRRYQNIARWYSFVITAGLLLDPEGLLGTKLVLGPRT